jgi:hypothetical protein
MIQKEVENLPDEITQKSYMSWFECFSSNATVYMPEFMKSLEKKRIETEKKLDELEKTES